MFDILNDVATASVAVTCTNSVDECLKSCDGFSMENLSFVRATPLEQNIDSEGEAYSVRFTHSSQHDAEHIQEKLLDIVVKKSGTDNSGIVLVSASLHEILTSESILYIGDENTNAYAYERALYVGGLESSNDSKGTDQRVITAKNGASGCEVKVTLKKAEAGAAEAAA
ncbi:hypothetical protein ANAPC1_00277 [Anaplasma phagocytophilum]|uniref:Uncharacterized protein n=1 Tax=Anaplasma phagocytophilum TaxID=948 RepID=A0AA45USF9_ANAPH|nr:hypothetical protein [Anaplasma phagocytophilum]SBO13937.1 hypothetical protein ANAPC1_00277 [Anaplasma phagocytophilum]